MTAKTPHVKLRQLLRADQDFDIAKHNPRATPGLDSSRRRTARNDLRVLGAQLSKMQEKMYASGREDEQAPRVLVVLQGLDTAGKGGVVRHVFGLVDPQGIALKAFKSPTREELEHDFLWRIRKALPGPGMIGVFDRSHYEDVLIVRVNELVPQDEWQARYEIINRFEEELAQSNTVIIKCFLNISRDEQQVRLLERLDRGDKHWKYNPGDVDVRMRWDDYMAAYTDAIKLCNKDAAPWYVIPSDRKWYRNWAIAKLLSEHLEDVKMSWPKADFDVAAEVERVKSS